MDGIDDAEHAHLIGVASDGPEAPFVFTCDLIRQTPVSSLSPPRRHQLHLRVAETIEWVYARSLDGPNGGDP